jgi:hypothetical protein
VKLAHESEQCIPLSAVTVALLLGGVQPLPRIFSRFLGLLRNVTVSIGFSMCLPQPRFMLGVRLFQSNTDNGSE